MELNKKILKIGLGLIYLILISTLGFAFSMKLVHPVFLKFYVEEMAFQDSGYYMPIELQIRYITNVYDKKRISSLQFIGNEKNTAQLWGYKINEEVKSYGLYNINTVKVNVDLNNMMGDFDRLEFNNAKASFNNGDTMDIDLGRLILHTADDFGVYFESNSSSSSSDGLSSSIKTLNKDLQLIGMESPLFDDAKDLYEIKVEDRDYRDIYGMQYKEGDMLTVNSTFSMPKNILDQYTQFELKPRLYFEGPNGRRTHINIYNLRHIPHDFDFWGIFRYLRLREEI